MKLMLYVILIFINTIVLIAIGSKGYKRTSAKGKELFVESLKIFGIFAAVEVVSVLIFTALLALSTQSTQTDIEIINGEIIRKNVVKKTCLYPGWHSSSDDFCTNENTREVIVGYTTVYCTDDKGDSYACGEEPDYETEYSYDYPWEKKYFLYSNIGYDYTVPRIDKQGANEPPRYTIVNIGDPVSATQQYDNYILLLDDSNILNPTNIVVDQALYNSVPPYPGRIYDFYKIDRLVTIGYNIDAQQRKLWNEHLSSISKMIGPLKQANPIIILTNDNRDIRDAVRKKWIGGKKNDVIVIIALTNEKAVWVDVITFMDNKGNEFFTSYIKNLIMEQQTFTPSETTLSIKQAIMEKFDRESMIKNFQTFKDEYLPSTPFILLAFVLSLIPVAGLVYFVYSERPLGNFKRRKLVPKFPPRNRF